MKVPARHKAWQQHVQTILKHFQLTLPPQTLDFTHDPHIAKLIQLDGCSAPLTHPPLDLPSLALQGVIASEEEDEPVAVEETYSGNYVVVFDPLDGSSNIDAGISTGSIFGVYAPSEECKLDDMDDPTKMMENCLLNTCQPGVHPSLSLSLYTLFSIPFCDAHTATLTLVLHPYCPWCLQRVWMLMSHCAAACVGGAFKIQHASTAFVCCPSHSSSVFVPLQQTHCRQETPYLLAFALGVSSPT